LLPPSFIEYAMRGGAAGVLVTGCREGGWAFRLGNLWTEERLAGTREPHFRGSRTGVSPRVAWAGRGEETRLASALDEFRRALAAERLRNADAIAHGLVSPERMTFHG
jgi:coenzyme F420-reducing hydrogenase delta subunit